MSGAKINQQDKSGTSPLMLAIEHKRSPRMVEWLIEQEADASLKNSLGVNALVLLCQKQGYKPEDMGKIARLLVQNKGMDLNIKDSHGMTPLLLAAQNNNHHIIQALLAPGVGVNVNARDTYYKREYCALHWAVKHKNLAMIYAIMRYPGVDPNLLTGEEVRQSPLQMAIQLSLTESQISSDIQKQRIYNILQHIEAQKSAAQKNNDLMRNELDEEQVSLLNQQKILLEKGQEQPVVASDHQKLSPLQWSIINAINMVNVFAGDVIQLLIEMGADINIFNAHKQSALVQNIATRNESVAKQLILHGCDISCVDSFGKSALIYACEHQLLEVVKLILNFGINVNVNLIDNSGLAAIYYAARNNNLEIVKMLAPRCTSQAVNSHDADGATAVVFAVAHNNYQMTTALLAANARLDGCNARGSAASSSPLLSALPRRCYLLCLRRCYPLCYRRCYPLCYRLALTFAICPARRRHRSAPGGRVRARQRGAAEAVHLPQPDQPADAAAEPREPEGRHCAAPGRQEQVPGVPAPAGQGD